MVLQYQDVALTIAIDMRLHSVIPAFNKWRDVDRRSHIHHNIPSEKLPQWLDWYMHVVTNRFQWWYHQCPGMIGNLLLWASHAYNGFKIKGQFYTGKLNCIPALQCIPCNLPFYDSYHYIEQFKVIFGYSCILRCNGIGLLYHMIRLNLT